MSATDLEEVLDYAIAQGCDVVNPTLARQQLGDIEYNKSRVAITESNRNQGLAVVNTNLLRDPWYKTLTNSYAGWGDGGGNGDGTFTIANRKNGVFGNEVSLTVGSNGTISDGSYLLQSTAQRRESDFFPTSGNLTFSCEPYVTNSSFPDNFELTIGITQRKTTDNSVILTVESEVITVDTKARVQSVSIAPKDYSNASYFVVYYRLREKTTGVGATILIANPKLEVGSRPTAYADDAPLDINDYEFYEGIVDVAATSVPIGTFTKVALTDVNKNFWQIINNEFLCRDTGFYTFDLVVSSVSAGPYTDSRQLVEVYKNGVAEGKRESNTLSGSLLRWKWHGTKYLKAGDKLDWRLFQDFGGSIDVDTGTYSFLRVCKVG